VRQHEAPRLGSLLGAAWQAWSGPAPAAVTQTLLVLACAGLFLQSAATLEVVYTFRVSYLLAALAVVVGLPHVVAGWRALPSWLVAGAGALVAFYLAADLLGDKEVLQGSARGGSYRDLVFLMDLLLGLGVVGAMSGLARRDRAVSQFLTALAVGAGLAALYGVYQWFAQHFGWPLSEVNNTLDSNFLTADGVQGTGLLGWERIRGTFLEPHSLGEFLAAGLPLVAYLAWRARGAARWAALGAVGASLFGLLMTASVPAWSVLCVAVLFTTILSAWGRGRRRPALAGAAVLVAILIGGPVAAAQPDFVARVTGRPAAQITISTAARTESWQRALNEWSARPLVGYGPGQSSVRLAHDPVLRIADHERPEKVLGSAHGVWAAALVDAGVFGFAAWIYLLGGIVVVCAVALLRRPDALHAASVAALAAVALDAQFSGDRLEIGTWLVIGFALAVATSAMPQRGDKEAADARTST
jgi:O-antigen ligase